MEAQHLTPSQYLVFLGCLVLGQALHLAVKAKSLQKKASAANMPFNIKDDFFKKDFIEIFITLICGFMVLVGYSEIVGFEPRIADSQKIFFMFVGYTGSSLVLSLLSKADKSVMKYIDQKTNIADFITNPQEQMDEYYYQLKNVNDEVKQDDGTYIAADQYAIQEGLTFDIPNLQLISSALLTNSITLRHPDLSNSIAMPVRKPK